MCRPADHAPGTFVEVFDRDGDLVGRGIYNRKSQIAVRLLTEDPAQLLDEAFLEQALDRAIALRRETLALGQSTNAYRLVNSEGDHLSGLIVDRYAGFLVVELFSAGWYRKLKWLLPALSRKLGGATVLVRADDLVEKREGFHVRDFEAERLGEARLKAEVEEGGLRFKVDLGHGHKTGFFCDQREHRLRVRQLARGKRVLDGFSYSGGFALNAARGGALSVIGVDLDESAVRLAQENARLNRLEAGFQHADMYAYLREAIAAGRKYDLVVLDPPKFASGRNEVEAGLRKYRDLNSLACGALAASGTLITCSCSGAVSEARFREAVLQGAKRARAELVFLESGGAGPDHPLIPEFPEGRYLKVLTFRREQGADEQSPTG
jgi:23S rRNA (cytosine1962-C5)-methyltransferase